MLGAVLDEGIAPLAAVGPLTNDGEGRTGTDETRAAIGAGVTGDGCGGAAGAGRTGEVEPRLSIKT